MNINESVVDFGGGHGTKKLAQTMINYRKRLTVLTSPADSGGNTGRIMKVFDVPPMGDFRNVCSGLSDREKVPGLADLMEMRTKLPDNPAHEYNGLCVGNLIIVSLIQKYKGDVAKAYAEYSRMLCVRGRVYPTSVTAAVLKATLDDGSVIYTEELIDTRDLKDPRKIVSIELDNKHHVSIFPKASEAIIHADILIPGPGDLYTSVIPNILVPGWKQALRQSHARIIVPVNIFTKKAETHGYTTADFIDIISDYLDRKIDVAICNTGSIPEYILKRYEAEGAYPVEYVESKNAKKWCRGNFADWSSGSVTHNDLAVQQILHV